MTTNSTVSAPVNAPANDIIILQISEAMMLVVVDEKTKRVLVYPPYLWATVADCLELWYKQQTPEICKFYKEKVSVNFNLALPDKTYVTFSKK